MAVPITVQPMAVVSAEVEAANVMIEDELLLLLLPSK